MGARGLLRIKPSSWVNETSFRCFCSFPARNSGHSRWSKIKHDKGKEDILKSRARTLLSQDISLASKYGGPDPALNSRLATAIVNAKKGSLSKTSIESAIAKGQGKSLSGASLENVTIEAMFPYGVAAVIECQTDCKARVLQDLRNIIKIRGGTVTPTSFLFEKKGRIWFDGKDGVGVDDVLDEAIEAGALDVEVEEGNKLVVDTDPSDITTVAQRLVDRFGLQLDRTEILHDPRSETMVSLGDDEGSELNDIIDMIEAEPSLQNVFVNVAP